MFPRQILNKQTVIHVFMCKGFITEVFLGEPVTRLHKEDKEGEEPGNRMISEESLGFSLNF